MVCPTLKAQLPPQPAGGPGRGVSKQQLTQQHGALLQPSLLQGLPVECVPSDTLPPGPALVPVFFSVGLINSR